MKFLFTLLFLCFPVFAHAGLVGFWTFEGDLCERGKKKPSLVGKPVGEVRYSSEVPSQLTHSQKSLNLAGGKNAVQVALDANLRTTTALTVAVWVKGWPAADHWGAFVALGGENAGGWQLRRYARTSNLDWTIADPKNRNFQGKTDLADGKWHHLVGVWDAYNQRRAIYVDGKRDAEETNVPFQLAPTTANLLFGTTQFPDGRLENFAGNGTQTMLLDDVVIYSHALTDAAIKQLAAGESPLLFRKTPPITPEEKARRLARLQAHSPPFRTVPEESDVMQLLLQSSQFSQAGRDYLVRCKAGEGKSALQIAAAKLADFIYFTRAPLRHPNAASCHIWQSTPTAWGCSIRRWSPGKATDKVLFDDPEGSIFDLNLSYDAKTIFFTHRKADEPCWQIYSMPVDGSSPPKKISRNPNVHDVAPTELPDGRLVFVSTRREGYTLCQPGPTSNLYTMNRDGSDLRCTSQNTLSDFSPHLLPDGRVLFTRWEYVDRDLTYRQSLWTQNPSGTNYQLFFGNTNREVGTFWQARPVPGHDNLVVSTFAPHHHHPYGAIGLIQPRLGIESKRNVAYCWLTPEFLNVGDKGRPFSFRDPFPVTDYLFLCAYGGEAEGRKRFGIWLLDLCGNRTLLRELSTTHCYGPVPVVMRKRPPRLPDFVAKADRQYVPTDPVDWQKERWSAMLVADVYEGVRGKIEPGRVATIRIMEQVRKADDLSHRAYDQSPVMSYATYYAKRCWGEVPVEKDGSAFFQVPALREVYLQLVDAEGRELHRQTSAVQTMPGELVSCVGCHEPRNDAAPTKAGGKTPLAARRSPTKLQFPSYAKDGMISYPDVVQPVLDEYCTECHSGPNPDGGYDLTGGKTRFFSISYDNLLGVSRSYRQHEMQTGRMLPSEAKKGKPLVHFYWLLRTPSGVGVPLETGSHASRLPDYLTEKHCKKKIPDEKKRRIYNWIDANAPYYGTYRSSRRYSAGYRDAFTDPQTKRNADWFTGDFSQVYNQRCGACHGAFPHPNDKDRVWSGHFAWVNLSKPELSAALTAHLAKKAGGRGLPTVKEKPKAAPLFSSKKDSDWQKMLGAIRQGHAILQKTPRVDGK